MAGKGHGMMVPYQFRWKCRQTDLSFLTHACPQGGGGVGNPRHQQPSPPQSGCPLEPCGHNRVVGECSPSALGQARIGVCFAPGVQGPVVLQERSAAPWEQRFGRRVYRVLIAENRRRSEHAMPRSPSTQVTSQATTAMAMAGHDRAGETLDLHARQELVADEQNDRRDDNGGDRP